MRVIKQLFLMTLLSLCTIAAALAQKTITGTVTDSETNEGLVGAAVTVKGTSKGAAADASGNYTIEVPDNATTLVFSFVGASLDSVIDAQRAAYNACVLQSGASTCRFDVSLKHILTPQTLLAFGCLGAIALIPVLVKKLRAKT